MNICNFESEKNSKSRKSNTDNKSLILELFVNRYFTRYVDRKYTALLSLLYQGSGEELQGRGEEWAYFKI